MRVISTALLVLIFCSFAGAQKMTQRELAGLKGKVKTLEDWSQKLSLDGKPVEEAKTESQTTFDEDGNVSELTRFGRGELHTTFFLNKGEWVSKSEFIGEDPLDKVKLPKGVKRYKYKDGPFDHQYKYKFDEKGRIVEVSGRDTGGLFLSNDKYVYDDGGRRVSETDRNGGLLIVSSHKYDNSGNLTETVSQQTVRSLKGTGDNFPTGPYVATEKFSSTTRFRDYAFDKQGNWTQRTVTVLNENGKVTSVHLQVRYFTYY